MHKAVIFVVVSFGFFTVAVAEENTRSVSGTVPKSSAPATNSETNSVLAPESVPTLRILPEDVIQDSVRMWRMWTNTYGVEWIFTEAGARKELAFWEAHIGEKVCTAIGSFITPPNEIISRPNQPQFTNCLEYDQPPAFKDYSEYARWKEGWLKWRTSKCCGVSEQDAKAITAGLRNR